MLMCILRFCCILHLILLQIFHNIFFINCSRLMSLLNYLSYTQKRLHLSYTQKHLYWRSGLVQVILSTLKMKWAFQAQLAQQA
jgi:hypothetical protein